MSEDHIAQRLLRSKPNATRKELETAYLGDVLYTMQECISTINLVLLKMHGDDRTESINALEEAISISRESFVLIRKWLEKTDLMADHHE